MTSGKKSAEAPRKNPSTLSLGTGLARNTQIGKEKAGTLLLYYLSPQTDWVRLYWVLFFFFFFLLLLSFQLRCRNTVALGSVLGYLCPSPCQRKSKKCSFLDAKFFFFAILSFSGFTFGPLSFSLCGLRCADHQAG